MQYFKNYIFEAINQDIAPDKRPPGIHKNITNMETFLTNKGLSAKVSKGTSIGISIPTVGTSTSDVLIIGSENIGSRLFIWVTDNSGEPNATSYDAIIEVLITDASINMIVKKEGNWYLSTLNPISSVGIQENENSSKLYWIDGFNQARYCNVDNSDIYEKVDYILNKPSPGIVTATLFGTSAVKTAVVRYAFTQYNISGSESKLSPYSSPVNISPSSGSAKIVCTQMLKDLYTNYRIYRLMWETYNAAPSIAIVDEGLIPDNNSVEFVDGGGSFITSIAIEQLVDVGSDLIIPHAIEAKKQILFFGNYSSDVYDINGDMRAYSYGGVEVNLGPDETIPANTLLPNLSLLDNGVSVDMAIKSDLGNNVTSLWAYYETNAGVLTLDSRQYYPSFTNTTGKTVYIKWTSSDGDFSGGYSGEVKVKTIRKTGPTTYVEVGVLFLILSSNNAVKLASVTFQEDNLGLLFEINNPTYNSFEQMFGYVYADVAESIDTIGTAVIPFASIPDASGYKYSVTSFYRLGSSANILVSGAWSNDIPMETYSDDGISATVTFDLNGVVFSYKGDTYTARFSLEVLGIRNEVISGGLILQDINGVISSFSSIGAVPIYHDAINPDTSVYKYTEIGGSVLGAQGEYVKLEVKIGVDPQDPRGNTTRYPKAGEYYRIGIVWYDGFGRNSPTKWVADLLIPYVNVTSTLNYHYYIEGSVIKAFPDNAVAFKFVIVERKIGDKTILMQGTVQPIAEYIVGPGIEDLNAGTFAFPNMREIKGDGTNTGSHFNISTLPLEGYDWPDRLSEQKYSELRPIDSIFTIINSPETFLYPVDIAANNIEVVGICKIDNLKDRTYLGYWNAFNGGVTTKTFNYIEFNIQANLNVVKDAPDSLFDDFESHEDRVDDAAIWMFSRTASTFYKSTKKNFDLLTCRYLESDSSLPLGSTAITNTVDITQFAGVLTANNKTNVGMEMAPYYIVEATIDWVITGTNPTPYALFREGVDASYGNNAITDRGIPIVDIKTNVANQYNGKSYAAKTSNTYIDASEAQTSINIPMTLWGDIYYGVYALPKTTSARRVAGSNVAAVYDYIFVLLESEVSVDFANKRLKDTNGELSSSVATSMQLQEVSFLLTYDKVFSQNPNTIISLPKLFNYIDIDKYLTRVTATLPKSVGEIIDSWTKVNFGSFIDLESQFGELTCFIRVRDEIVVFQPNGIAMLSILPVAQTVTGSGRINLGKGKVLDDYRYIKVDTGSDNKQAVAVQNDRVFYIDTVNKSLNAMTEGAISTLIGFNSVTQANIRDAVSDYLINGGEGFVWIDENMKQVFFKFSKSFPMLAYNYEKKIFVHSRTYEADYFFTSGRVSLAGKSGKLYVLNAGKIGDYFGEKQPASIEMVVEPFPGVDKVFDAIEVSKQGEENLTDIKVTGSSGRVSGSTTLPIIWKSKFDKHIMHLPRVENSRDRFREKNVTLLLEYSGDKDLDIDRVMIKFTAKK